MNSADVAWWLLFVWFAGNLVVRVLLVLGLEMVALWAHAHRPDLLDTQVPSMERLMRNAPWYLVVTWMLVIIRGGAM